MNTAIDRALAYPAYFVKVLNTYRFQVRNVLLRRRRAPIPSRMFSEKVSIIIPTLSKGNHAGHLASLRNLLAEYLPGQIHNNYEALVYCDGPNPMVEAMVRSLNDDRIRVYMTDETIGKWGHPQTRMGIVAATGTFFVRMNDDNKPYKNYLQTLIQGFDREVGVVYGRIIYKGEARIAHRNSLVHSFVIPGDLRGELRLRNIDCMNYMVRMDLAKRHAEDWRDIYAADWGFIEALLNSGVKAEFRDEIIGEKR